MTTTSQERFEQATHARKMREDSEYRAQQIKERVVARMLKGGDCYPFTSEHVAEAMQNLDEDMLDRLSRKLEGLDTCEAGQQLRAEIRLYWEEVATALTKKEVDKLY